MKTKTASRLSILSMLTILVLSSCSTSKPLPMRTVSAPTPTMEMVSVELPGDQAGFFLMKDETLISLKAQHLTEQESVYGYGLPQTDDPQPLAVISGDSIDTNSLLLRRMIGGIGFYPQPNRDLGGVVVQAVRPGFGADTGGLQPNDLILAVDGEPLKEMLYFADFDARFQKVITGELGSRVSLTVERAGTELELEVSRDLPTLPSVLDTMTGSVPLRRAEGQGQVQLVSEAALAPGLYCYQAGISASSFGDLYCFIEGNLEVAWPVPPAPISSTRDLFASSNFQKTDCRFPILEQKVECGNLSVPENYGKPDGKKIQIHVAAFRSSSDLRPDPVIYLHGGPGGGALEWMAGAYVSGYQRLFPNREFIVFDQRGTGYSEPRLECPSLVEEYARSLSENQRVSLLGWESTQMDSCKKDLEKLGVDLSAYTTQSNAADLHALIQALGYEQVNLFGQSYGTQLALTYLREYGSEASIRSVVLDGVIPPEADLLAERGQNAQAAWEAIFTACESDPACRTSNPDVRSAFQKLLERLANQPVTVQAVNPLDGLPQTVVVNDFLFLEALYRSSYQSDWIPRIPALITTLDKGDETLIDSALTNVFLSAASVDHGIYYSISCNDLTNPASPVENTSLALPLKNYFDDIAQNMLAACKTWPVAPTSSMMGQPTVSDVPSLLLVGSFDPITPPVWGRLAVQSLSKGYLYEFPAEAHDVMAFNACAQTITYQFIENPVEPSDACLNNLTGPIFETP